MTGTTPTATADRIRRSALALFARQGYEATTLAQIAAAVGIKKPSLYNHVDSKEALFLTLAERVEAEFFDVLDNSLTRYDHADARERLYALVRDLGAFIFLEDYGVFYKRFMLFPPAALHDKMRALNARSEARMDGALRRLFARGRAAGELADMPERRFIAAFYCLVDGLFSERFLYTREEYSRRMEAAWTVFWAGVRARPRPEA